MADIVERLRELDKMLCQRFARSAPIEAALLQAGMGTRDLPTREECKEWGITLGVPDDVRAVLTASEVDKLRTALDAAGFAIVRKAADESERLRAALQELMEFVDEYSDVVDGDDGVPEPNRAMSLLVIARAALAKDSQTS